MLFHKSHNLKLNKLQLEFEPTSRQIKERATTLCLCNKKVRRKKEWVRTSDKFLLKNHLHNEQTIDFEGFFPFLLSITIACHTEKSQTD